MATFRSHNEDKNNFLDQLENLFSTSYESTTRELSLNYPLVDIIEDSNGFTLKADLPGLSKGDFEICIDGQVLTISGEKKQIPYTGKERYRHFERHFGLFKRSFNLPPNIDTDSIEAFYNDGVLDIVIAKNIKGTTNALMIDTE